MSNKKVVKTTFAVGLSVLLLDAVASTPPSAGLALLPDKKVHLGMKSTRSLDAGDDVEEEVEQEVEEEVEQEVEEEVEQEVEEEVEQEVEEDVEQGVEEEVEQEVEEEVEQEVEEEVEQEVEEDVEQEVEEDVEEDVEQDVEQDVEEEVEQDVEKEIEQDSEDETEKEAEDEAEKEVEREVETKADEQPGTEEDEDDKSEEKHNTDEGEDSRSERSSLRRAAQATGRVASIIELAEDFDHAKIYTNDWLVLNKPEDKTFIASRGYRVLEKRYLPSLNRNLLRVEAPASFKLNQQGKQLLGRLNTSQRAVDLNHVYEISSKKSVARTSEFMPANMLALPSFSGAQRVGIIDTRVDSSHPTLQSVKVLSKEFSERVPGSDSSHANSVASILAGKNEHYQGLLTNVDIYSASVFFNDKDNGDVTTTASLIKALDWMVQQNIRVINMSLAGPPNTLLSQAIDAYCAKGVVVIAAVGNSGPHSKPMYPAAYDCVVGVTAISSQERIYRRAVRGSQVDIAAYGVGIMAADNKGGFTSVTGTSFATPFVTAYVLSQISQGVEPNLSDDAALGLFFKQVKDLGSPGKDPVYGVGALINSK